MQYQFQYNISAQTLPERAVFGGKKENICTIGRFRIYYKLEETGIRVNKQGRTAPLPQERSCKQMGYQALELKKVLRIDRIYSVHYFEYGPD